MARVWAEAVGCKVSRADAETLQAGLMGAGHEPAPSADKADVAVLTTCCVTAEAERSSRQRVRRLAARGLPVVVTGCAAVYREEQFAADRVLTCPREGVPAAVAALLGGEAAAARPGAASAAPSGTRGRRTRAVLKVQDGCTSACTYCAVRLVRGGPWSMPAADVSSAARAALAGGCGELVVSGINLGLYAGDRAGGRLESGPDAAAGAVVDPAATARAVASSSPAVRGIGAPDTVGLAELVTGLAGLPGLLRLRLSSIEPLHVDHRLLDALCHPRVARHLHLPLQSADDGVLAEMGRPYTFARYLEAAGAVRDRLPGAMISTDVIVGFPTESAAAFDRTLAAIGELRHFGRVHVFPYSSRPGTPAGRLTPLPAAELRRRRHEALAAAGQAADDFARGLVGKTVEVLLEDRRDGIWRGYSSEYVRCRVEGEGRRGALVRAQARRRDGAELICETL